MGDALSRQAVAARVAERVVGCSVTLFGEPVAQTAAGPDPQGYGPLLAPFPNSWTTVAAPKLTWERRNAVSSETRAPVL